MVYFCTRRQPTWTHSILTDSGKLNEKYRIRISVIFHPCTRKVLFIIWHIVKRLSVHLFFEVNQSVFQKAVRVTVIL